jgi:sigma-E factor negative regulatory protein RseC
MNENEAIVQRLDGEYVWVDFQSAACADCKESGSCGLSNGQGKRLQRFYNNIGAHVGDRVILSMPEGAVLKAAFQCYLLPLLLLLVLAAGGMALAREIGAVLGVVIGLLLGWYNLRRAGKRQPQPVMRIKPAVMDFYRNLPL